MTRAPRRVSAALALATATAPTASAGGAPAPVTAADRAAIRGVIEGQLSAFRCDDGARAYAYASPALRRRFPSPEMFVAILRTGYQPAYRPREVEFRELIDLAGEPTQLALVVGPDDDRPVIAHYVMQRQADGTWRINGCLLVEARDLTA